MHKLELTHEETQKIVIGSSVLMKMVGFAFAAWAGVVGWVGVSLINKVDVMATNFNGYVGTMEHRVTSLEESQKAQDIEMKELLHALQDQHDAARDRRK